MPKTTLWILAQILFCTGFAQAQITFVDNTSGLPLADSSDGVGVAWGDYDKDGLMDIYLLNQDGANKLFRNIDGVRFIDAGAADPLVAPLEDAGASNGAAWGDINNDGDLDLYMSDRDTSNKLIERQGGGVYADITAAPLHNTGNSQGVAWGDYDNDGKIDLYLANRSTANKLFKNVFDGVTIAFEDAAIAVLEDTGDSRGVAWADYDNDGDLDLYVVNHNTANKLFRNDGGEVFVSIAGVIADEGPGRGAAWGDYDNDGDLDLYLSNHAAANRLFENLGSDEFEDVTSGPVADAGKGRSVAWGDFDNDGDLDLYLVNSGSANKLFRNDDGGTFVDDTPSPLDDAGTGSGMAIADFDNDGDLDIYQAAFGGPNKLFKNEAANGNKWLKVKLSRGSAALGVGSRVTVTVDGTTYIREISGGSGFLSQNSQVAHFGLGAATLVDLVEVVWPNGLRQTAKSVGVNDEVVFEEVLVEDLPRPGEVDLEIVPDTPYLIVSWTPPVIPDAPVIAGLLVTAAGDCELSDGTPATLLKLSLTYTDANGDVDAASQVRIFPGLSTLGAEINLIAGSLVPGADPSSGTLSFDLCTFFGDETFLELAVEILDAAGNSSNFLIVEIINPEFSNNPNLVTGAQPRLQYGGLSFDSGAAGLSTYAVKQTLEILGYKIERFDKTKQITELIAIVPPFLLSYIDDLTTPNTGYTYFVSTLYAAGESAQEPQDDFSLDIADGELFKRVVDGEVFDNLSLSAGCSWGDIDNDGDLDVFVANDANRTNFLFENNGDGTFTHNSASTVVTEKSYSHGGSFGDFDNDGDLDLFVANWQASSFLYRNDGSGNFEKLTNTSLYPMVAGEAFANSGAWADYDNDGHLDLFVAKGFNLQNSLYRNNGDGTFEEAQNFLMDANGGSITDTGRSTGGFWGDYTNDGKMDLFVTNREDNNFLYENNGDGTFTKVSSGAIVGDGGNSNGASWGDFNNDGKMDLFVANEKNANQDRKNFLYLNLGQQGGAVQFQKITTDEIVTDADDSWGSGWADFDNDGDLDIVVTNQSSPNTLYRNDGNNDFFRIDEGNIGNNGGDSRGTGWSDYTDDGYIDMLLLNLDSAVENPHNLLYENLKAVPNKWLKIKAIGTVSNRSAIGAKIHVKSSGIWQMQEISSYTGWGSQNSMELTFGVGAAASIDSIRVEWPSGITQYLTQVTSETSLTITETAANNPPGSFTRFLPQDNQEVSRDDVLFSWTEAIDPDGDDVTYELNINVENIDTTFANLSDASFTFDFAALQLPTQQLPVSWSVTAFDENTASSTPTNGDGNFTLDSLVTSIGDPFPGTVPEKFALHANYPNPFNAGTVLSYDVPQTARIRLVIYTVLGQSVRTLVNEEQGPGSYRVPWQGLDDTGLPVSSGVYLYRLETSGEFSATGKMLLLR